MEEFIKVIGNVVITKIYNDGRREVVWDDHNLVVNVGKTILAKLLSHDANYLNDYISTIAFGTGTAAVTSTDTAMQAQQFSAAVTTSYPAYNQVTFSATMGATDGGSYTYTELGLLSASGKMFAHLIVSAITKSAAYKIQVDWTMTFP
ncbi:phage tail protein [Oryzomonas rubra]|uniref:Uncharacterized protein n=1 Tax=Oryzomonas rubra TaxID=2509454 RepID=A0A5A9XAT5_9BACT|nr:phage tail protein [Oryzomonas rubra]KAA0888781.1 hypothetical protein ET418_15485 [Oryzomonas rubra]